VKLALIYPPACDPTAPYPAIPALAGFLRPQGIEVLPIDANLDGFLALLRREPLTRLAATSSGASPVCDADARSTIRHNSNCWRSCG